MVYWATESVPYTGMFDTGNGVGARSFHIDDVVPSGRNRYEAQIGQLVKCLGPVSGTLLVKITSASAARSRIRSSGVLSYTANSPNAETGSPGVVAGV